MKNETGVSQMAEDFDAIQSVQSSCFVEQKLESYGK